jgi:DNA polymerase-3 subunit alpha
MEEFIRRKNNPSLVKYETDLLEEVLWDTYGVIVYQEQIMFAAMKLAGYSASEADDLRKAIAKKIKENLIEAYAIYMRSINQERNQPFYERYDKKRRAPKEALLDFMISHFHARAR